MAKHIKSEAERAPEVTIGIDVSDQSAEYCTLDAQGEVTKAGHFRLTRGELHKRFGTMTRARIALEAGAHSAWMSELLMACGHEVIVANPRELHSISGSNRKSDRNDAEQLARLARVDPALLRPVSLRSVDRQLDLVLIRSRAMLVEARTRLINGARGMVKIFGERIPSCTTRSIVARAMASLSPALGEVLKRLLEQIDILSEAIARCDEDVKALAEKRSAETKWLEQVPGVGPVTAVTFVLTIGDPHRFAHSRDVGAYVGLVPRRKQSGGLDPQLRISKAGDRYLRAVLVQCAHHILGRWGPDSALRAWGMDKAATGRRSKKRALVAVARKLAILLHRLWITKDTYQPFPKVRPAGVTCA